jgi:hypothetical protein
LGLVKRDRYGNEKGIHGGGGVVKNVRHNGGMVKGGGVDLGEEVVYSRILLYTAAQPH